MAASFSHWSRYLPNYWLNLMLGDFKAHCKDSLKTAWQTPAWQVGAAFEDRCGRGLATISIAVKKLEDDLDL